MMRDYSQIAQNYAVAVCNGDIPAPKAVIAACRKSLDEWGRDPSPEWPYRFDKKAAADACGFIERLPHTQGEWARRGELISLEPWQVWIICSLFGWKRTDNKQRRFRTAMIELGRKNGKSMLAAVIGLYMLLEDREPAAQIFSAATSTNQAKISWEAAVRILKKMPAMQKAYGIRRLAHSITVPATHSVFRALSSEDRGSISLDGLNPHCAIVDELHAHASPATFNALESALGARSQPLLFVITTAGSRRDGVCYQLHQYAIKVATGVTQDPSFFAAIFALDEAIGETDQWRKPEIWRMANPNLGVSVSFDDIARQAKKAEAEPSFLSNFLTKRLCVWVNADQALFDASKIIAAADPDLIREACRRQECIVGIDLAPQHDFSAVCYLFPLEDGSYIAFADHFLPESEVKENQLFTTWAAQGLIHKTPGNVMDYEAVMDSVIAARDELDFQIKEICFDPWQATELSIKLADAGFECVNIPIRVTHLSEPTKKLGALIAEEKLITAANENAPLVYCLSNVVGHFDRKDNVLPTRPPDRRQKIDSAMALILALSRAISYRSGPTSIYEDPSIGIWT
jgi:phage terminase large subunit-like protein